jgi:hypothetical protein
MSMRSLLLGLAACSAWAVAASVGSAPRAALATDGIVQTTAVDYHFARPHIMQTKVDQQAYDRVVMPDCSNGGMPGDPALPQAGATILLPQGSELADVRVIAGAPVSLGTGFNVEPVGTPYPLSADPAEIPVPTPNPAIYAGAAPFPAERFEQIGVHSFRGYQMLTLKLHPVEFIPATGELRYYPDMRVEVVTADTGQATEMFRGLAIDEAEVRQRVDNPKDIASYRAAGKRGDRSFDLLILTVNQYVDEFQPLKDYHDAHGIPTEIHTVSNTDPAAVRDYIRDRYTADGIQYVIIGGDDNVIPAQNLYVKAWDGGDVETAMPGDIYFACLDGSWNNDGDSRIGEPNDGPGGGDVDLVADVYVGRASIGSSTEATRFVNKTIGYLQGQHDHKDKVLLVGEYLGFGGISDYAGPMMDQLVNQSSADGYTTKGIPSSDYTIDKLYEKNGNWSKSDLASRINSGVHFLNHLGHGSPDYAMKFYNNDILSLLSNDDQVFVYSQTCLAGHFDGTDCWAETMNIKTDAGGFAVIMNARYGWGSGYSTDGPSQRFNRQFWDAVFNASEGKTQLGPANHDSKEDNIYRINQSCMRWCYYELNLFGDPTVSLTEMNGIKVTPSTDLIADGPIGGPFSPASKAYTITNVGDSPVTYTVTENQPWLDLDNAGGTLAGGASTTVTVTINDYADSLTAGIYSGSVMFTNTTDGVGDASRSVELTVGVPEIVYEWTFDTDPGWSTEGDWAFGQPTGGGGEYGNPDPTSGYTGTNVYGYNLNGDYPNDMPAYDLVTTAIDCSDLIDTRLIFRRYLNVEQPAYDHADIRVSRNGSTFTKIWENGETIEDSNWQLVEYDISDIADGEETAYIRWTMGSTDGGWRYSGWNIDDVQIKAINANPPQPGIEHQVVEVPISSEAIADDPTLAGAKCYDLQVVITDNDDWTASGVVVSVDGMFYQHGIADADTPQSNFWSAMPSLEYDSFFCTRDFTSPGFAEGPFNSDDEIVASWFDTVNTGNGTYTIARFTVTSGTTLHIEGDSTANHTGGQLHHYVFDVDLNMGTPCPGDLNGDGLRDLSDLGILLASFEVDDGGDIDGDGDTDLADLGSLLAVYEVDCP